MTLILPHTFSDGPGNVASGVQVMDNFETLRLKVDLPASGIAHPSATFVPTNVHQAIAWTPTPTVTIDAGQVLLVDLVMDLLPVANTLSAALTVAGAEQAGMNASAYATVTQVYRFSGAGTYVLGANVWASSSAGAFGAASSAIRWQVLSQ